MTRHTAALPLLIGLLMTIGIQLAPGQPKAPLNPVTQLARQFMAETGKKQAMHVIAIDGVPEASVPAFEFVRWLEAKVPAHAGYRGTKRMDVRAGKLLLVTTVQPEYFDWLVRRGT